jgi:Domain of unknown function (DUF222)
MRSSSRDEVVEVLDVLEAGFKRALDLRCDALTTPEHLAVLERCEQLRRWLPAVEHPVINQLSDHADPAELGGKLAGALADRLRITRAEASRRIHDAADLGERTALTGEPLAPLLPATAQAQRNGDLGAGHIAVIRSFMHRLPDVVDLETRATAEAHLARLAGEHRPDELARLADTLTDCLNPDGDYTEHDRARRRGLILGRQDLDGMSPITGYLTPQARAALDAVLAKLAAPDTNDTRSTAQRNHDALLTLARNALSSGELGQHNGLPASIIVTTTLQDLEAAAGKALTAGGTLLPMSDVIRLAGHAHHYLAIFDTGTALALYHTKRIASPAQRIMLHANDRGCSFPGCSVPGYLCEVHHCNPYATNPVTDIDNLTLACGPHHKLADHGWKTRKHHNGNTQWIPPAHLDHGQPRTNTFHHPEKLLQDSDDEDDDA